MAIATARQRIRRLLAEQQVASFRKARYGERAIAPLWTPFKGKPQEQAYYSPADELFYGGAGGSGKGGACYGMEWAIANIPNFKPSEYENIRLRVPPDIERMDTTVLMAAGEFKAMSRVVKGDRIMAPDGTIQYVTAVFERGILPVFEVTFDDSVAVKCDADHLWAVMGDEVKVLSTSQVQAAIALGHDLRVPMCTPLFIDRSHWANGDRQSRALALARSLGFWARADGDWVDVRSGADGKRVESVRAIAPTYVRCISVSHPSRLYLTDGYTCTHNSDLLLGAAGTRHRHSVIYRRVFPNLRALIERSREIYNRSGDRHGEDSFNESLHLWRLQDGRTIEFKACQFEKDLSKQQGQAHDLKNFDEITEMPEKFFRFINIWNRNADSRYPNQRCRVIATGNPPTTAEGEWVIDYWAPWLDDQYPRPAAAGELVWCGRALLADGDRLRDENPDLHIHFFGIPDESGECDFEYARTPADIAFEHGQGDRPLPRPTYQHASETKEGRSRCFIPGKVEDNPILMAQGYDKQLEALPAFFRERFRYGRFARISEDTDLQIIPSQWIRDAMERWKLFMGTDRTMPTKEAIALFKQKSSNPQQSAVGCDPARGGADKTAIAIRYGDWFAPVLKIPGSETPHGSDVARAIAQVFEFGATVNIDVIGIGSSPYDSCLGAGLATVPLNGAEAATRRFRGKQVPETDRSGSLRFSNRRALWVWRFMEALDPQHGSTLMLPPDPTLLSDLTSFRRKNTTGQTIAVELKADIKKRLGRSPDIGEAVIYAFIQEKLGTRSLHSTEENLADEMNAVL